MFTVELYARIRRAVMVDGLSRREAAKRFGVHRNTITKMLQFSVPPGYRRRERPASKKLGPYMAWIDAILEGDRERSQEAAPHGANWLVFLRPASRLLLRRWQTTQPMWLVGPGQVFLPFLERQVLTQSRSGARIQNRFNSAGRHKRHLRGGSFHKVRQLPRARVQVPVPDSMEQSLGWAHDRR